MLEAFNTRYKTTGITYQGENEPKPTTQLGSLVDVNFLPIIGLGGEIDWGVQPYDPGTNGGIVGTVSYDTTRNELDPADAVTETYQPGIPGVHVHLFVPKACDTTDPTQTCRQGYQLDSTGAFIKGPEVADTYTSETWAPPRGCTARHVQRPAADRPAGAAGVRHRRQPDVRRGADDGRRHRAVATARPGAASQTVNGNYGFATSKINLYPPTDTAQPRPGPRPRALRHRCRRRLRRARTCRPRTTSSRSTSRTTRSTASRCTR